MRLIDADALLNETRTDYPDVPFDALCKMVKWFTKIVGEQPTIAAPRWVRCEDELPDENKDVLLCYEWTGISGTKYREVTVSSIREALGQRFSPLYWIPLPEPPKEDA